MEFVRRRKPVRSCLNTRGAETVFCFAFAAQRVVDPRLILTSLTITKVNSQLAAVFTRERHFVTTVDQRNVVVRSSCVRSVLPLLRLEIESAVKVST